MKVKSVLILIITLLFVLNVQGQLLWKISGNGLSKNSYLFGTHHLIDKNLIPQFDSIAAVCNLSDAVVGEMDLKTPGIQKKMLKGSIMKGKKMKDLVSSSDYQLLDTEFKAIMGVGMNVLGSFKPMMLMSMHQLVLYQKATGSKKQPRPVDDLFQKQARLAKKNVFGLETLEMQMDLLFNNISLERQAEILLYEVREKVQMFADLKQLNDIYISGDLVRLNALDVEDESLKPDERRMLVDDRNRNWLKQLPALMKEQSCFVAVGCLHLVGENGLIHQLEMNGFKLEAVRF